MVNLKSIRSEIKLFWKFTKKQPWNFQEKKTTLKEFHH